MLTVAEEAAGPDDGASSLSDLRFFLTSVAERWFGCLSESVVSTTRLLERWLGTYDPLLAIVDSAAGTGCAR